MVFFKSGSVRPESASTVQLTSGSFKRKSILRLNNVLKMLVENLRNYCNTTSLHGFNYITLTTNSLAEKLFWLCVVIISIIVTIGLVYFSWLWINKTPIVTVIENTHYPTWSIPFPAVSICSLNIISKRKAKQLASSLLRFDNISDEHIMTLFQVVLDIEYSKRNFSNYYERFTRLITMNNLTIEGLMNKLRPDCMEMFKRCKWKGNTTPCELLFSRFGITSYICCSFNYRSNVKEFALPPGTPIMPIRKPHRITSCGYKTGLSVEMTTQAEDYWGSFYSNYGFRVLIHDPHDFADENSKVNIFTMNQETFLRITPTSTYATEAVRNLDVSKRKCYYADEGNTFILKEYSFNNCMAECRNLLLFEICGCILPTLNNGGDGTLSCTLEQYSCVLNNFGMYATEIRCFAIHKIDLYSRADPKSMENLGEKKVTKSFPCNCLESCETNVYNTEMTMGNLKRSTVEGTNNSIFSNDSCLLHVFYGSLQATRYRADVFEDWVTSLATFGGLMGLIIGFSIVSAFEFIYFLTLRPLFNYFFNTA